ncbi:hypothetical protein TGAMA5MH_03813 [Trichoderma gamsii]|uniref:BTB domain-containing protein n=1 Tax=Trichoderma gamsii TaxID=398673 RepID=A0A2K0TFX3_9HYPO|nr:hypothetical protein TGAMA5MH_03813 [Trichoderma gamsii]
MFIPSYAEKERVYRDEACRRVFTQFNNSALRKRKKIKEVVTFKNLFVSGLSEPQLIETIHSLLKDGIFQWNSTDTAQVIFPQLFTPQISNLQQTKDHTFRNAVPVDMSVNAGLQNELLISMEWLLLTGTYSDLIMSAGRQYNLHKSVICPRSSALKLACKHNKTPTTTIDLKEEDDEAVDRLIQYFYRLNYDTHNAVPIDAESSIAPVPPFDRTEESENAKPSDLLLHKNLRQPFRATGIPTISMKQSRKLILRQ